MFTPDTKVVEEVDQIWDSFTVGYNIVHECFSIGLVSWFSGDRPVAACSRMVRITTSTTSIV